ncbi:DUF805 domain-containing protein [uncultured Roseibium sp.]|uniref:DUF805 domain-containing protein n=1 Tax=uncultured Roseibium sp. TaxID=1936171 RepID=UPI003216C49E
MAFLFNPFQGQMTRLQWWLAQLGIFAAAFAGLFLTAFLLSDRSEPVSTRTSGETLALTGLLLSVLFANFSTCLNRLRDSGRSGFWYLTFLLPTAGTGLMIYFCGIERGRDVSMKPPVTTDTPPSQANPTPPPLPTVLRSGRRTFGRRRA